AYSGGVIKNHFPFQNLIIDLSTLSIAKSKTPLLRDHTQSQVAGIAEVKIDKNVSFSGRVFKKSVYGKEILDLSEEGFEWEMSLGVFDGSIEEFNDEREINGHKLNGGVVL